ncbi:hypothetical protein NQ315_015166 [Exocentrus adspersus]|uniref:Uncharacterized protein n=1 Tax=Exocentrus adspersus TaxID=1586481 RepID=A0AAV8V4X2_9CUCU|nr:hypothetical protein NQ315_015166 [Exocentrus adspersus]
MSGRGRKAKCNKEENQEEIRTEETQEDRPTDEGAVEGAEQETEPKSEEKEGWQNMIIAVLENMNKKMDEVERKRKEEEMEKEKIVMEQAKEMEKRRRDEAERLERSIKGNIQNIEKKVEENTECVKGNIKNFGEVIEQKMREFKEDIKKEQQNWRTEMEKEIHHIGKITQEICDQMKEQEKNCQAKKEEVIKEVRHMTKEIKERQDTLQNNFEILDNIIQQDREAINKVKEEMKKGINTGDMKENQENRQMIERLQEEWKQVQKRTKGQETKYITCQGDRNKHKFEGNVSKLHPEVFIKTMERRLKEVEEPEEMKEILRENLDKVALTWFIGKEKEMDNFETFKELFIQHFWSETQQTIVREQLYFGKYNEKLPDSLTVYAMKLYARAQYLKPAMEESEIVLYLSRHYKPEVAETIAIQNIKKMEQLYNYLGRIERNMKGQNMKNQDVRYNENRYSNKREINVSNKYDSDDTDNRGRNFQRQGPYNDNTKYPQNFNNHNRNRTNVNEHNYNRDNFRQGQQNNGYNYNQQRNFGNNNYNRFNTDNNRNNYNRFNNDNRTNNYNRCDNDNGREYKGNFHNNGTGVDRNAGQQNGQGQGNQYQAQGRQRQVNLQSIDRQTQSLDREYENGQSGTYTGNQQNTYTTATIHKHNSNPDMYIQSADNQNF